MNERVTFKIDDIRLGSYNCDKIRYGKTQDGRDYACIDFDTNKSTFVQSYNINAIKNIITMIDGKPKVVTFYRYTTSAGKEYTRFKFAYEV